MRAATLVREAEMADDDESLVIPPRDYTDIANLQKASVLEEFLEHPLTASLEAITAAFANGGKGLIVSAGRIAQGLVKGQVYEQIAWELRALREAGRLPNNLGETKHGLHTWAELMRIIDDECPDADRLEALKAAFYAVNKVGTADAEKITPFQLWQISKELRSGEIVLLKALNEHANYIGNVTGQQWEQYVSEKSGLGITELVQLYVKRLNESMLVILDDRDGATSRQHIAGVPNVPKYRITNLGRRLCQNIQSYTIDLNAASGS